jgi:hypothetical protein
MREGHQSDKIDARGLAELLRLRRNRAIASVDSMLENGGRQSRPVKRLPTLPIAALIQYCGYFASIV